MVGSLLLRGMLVGIFAGILAFGYARVYGEPQIDRAIAFEEATAQASGAAPEAEIVSRETQASAGLLTGLLVYGASIGGLFSLVFAYIYGRVSNFGPRGTAALLALAGFVAVVLVPNLIYPANPPSVGSADTIGARTELFFVMLVVSVAASTGAVALARRLWPRYGAWTASIIAGLAFVFIITVAQSALPAINEVPENFSADLLWRFRIAAIGTQVVLWTTIGLAFGGAVEASLSGRPTRPSPARPFR
jgi:predicted cobalt transporter CbtA